MNVFKKSRIGINKVKALFLIASVAVANTVNAVGLPVTSAPSTAPADGDYIGLIKGYAFDLFVVAGLIIGTYAFISVSTNMVSTYKEIANGKKTWGDMGMHGGMGVLLLVFVIYLLTEASDIIA